MDVEIGSYDGFRFIESVDGKRTFIAGLRPVPDPLPPWAMRVARLSVPDRTTHDRPLTHGSNGSKVVWS